MLQRLNPARHPLNSLYFSQTSSEIGEAALLQAPSSSAPTLMVGVGFPLAGVPGTPALHLESHFPACGHLVGWRRHHRARFNDQLIACQEALSDLARPSVPPAQSRCLPQDGGRQLHRRPPRSRAAAERDRHHRHHLVFRPERGCGHMGEKPGVGGWPGWHWGVGAGLS